MSDSSSMMIVMMMGMMASCVMSVIGGLGLWYMQDPTLGGLLEDLGGDTPPPDDEGPAAGDESGSNTSLPLDQKVYIHGLLDSCGGDGKSYTLLYAKSDVDVDSDCKRDDGKKDDYLWTIKAKKVGKWTYYTIKNAGKSKYLSIGDAKDNLSLSSSEFLWRLKKQSDDATAYTVSSKDAVDGDKKRHLDFWGGNCTTDGKNPRIRTYQVTGDLGKGGNNSRFKFRAAKSGWKGAVKNAC